MNVTSTCHKSDCVSSKWHIHTLEGFFTTNKSKKDNHGFYISDLMIILRISSTIFLYVLIFWGFLCGLEGTTFLYTYFIEMFYFQLSISAKYIIVYPMHAPQIFDTKTYSILRLNYFNNNKKQCVFISYSKIFLKNRLHWHCVLQSWHLIENCKLYNLEIFSQNCQFL